jgi:dephospho-CoA kinase
MLRDHTLSPEQLKARISSQLPSEYKIQRSTFSIDNNGKEVDLTFICIFRLNRGDKSAARKDL